MFAKPPRFDPTRATQADMAPIDYSARPTFIRRLSSKSFCEDAVPNEKLLVLTALRIVFCEWQETLDRSDYDFRHTGHVVELVNEDEVKGTLLKRRWLRENLDRLRYCLNILEGDMFHDEGDSDVTPNDKVERIFSDLKADYFDLISRTEDHIARANQSLATFTSLIAIEESRKAIKQAESIGYGSTKRNETSSTHW